MFWERFFNYVAATLIIVVLCAAGTLLFKAATATGKIEYCYVSENQQSAYPFYHLQGFREWRPDRLIVTAKTYEEVVQHAAAIKCNLGVEP